MAKPLTTIETALALAPSGGRVALAAGMYDEQIYIDKPVTLEGRCPSLTRLRWTGSSPAAYVVRVFDAADVALRRLAIEGIGTGVQLWSATGAVMDEILVQGAQVTGIFVSGSSVTISRSWIRDTLAKPSEKTFGRAIEASQGSSLSLMNSAITGNREISIMLAGATTHGELTGDLIEGTLPQESDGTAGIGIVMIQAATTTPPEYISKTPGPTPS
jgi:hypothetical protein